MREREKERRKRKRRSVSFRDGTSYVLRDDGIRGNRAYRANVLSSRYFRSSNTWKTIRGNGGESRKKMEYGRFFFWGRVKLFDGYFRMILINLARNLRLDLVYSLSFDNRDSKVNIFSYAKNNRVRKFNETSTNFRNEFNTNKESEFYDRILLRIALRSKRC